MNGFENFSAIGRIDEIQDPYINPKTGFTKRIFTITAGNGKAIHLESHYHKAKELEGLKRSDLVHVEFTIKGRTLKNGNKINNLIAQKIKLI